MAPVVVLLLIAALFCAAIAAGVCGLLVASALGTAHDTAREHLANLCRSMARRSREMRPVAHILARREEHRRARALEAAAPEAFRSLAIALDAGSSLDGALEYAAENCAEPLASELKRVIWDLQAGQGFEEAMASFRSRAGSSELSYLAVAMEIQHRAGGGMRGVLGVAAEALRESAELERELDAQTAQGRLSARIVAALPAALALLISMFSPTYFAAFFSSALGFFLFVFALALEVVGVLAVRRLLSLDLSSGLGGGAA